MAQTNIQHNKEQEIKKRHLTPFPTKLGMLYIEDINHQENREEPDRIKIFDSNLHYFDYYPIDWLEDNADEENMSVKKYFLNLLRPIADAPTVDEFFHKLGTFYECCSQNWKDVADYIKRKYDYTISTKEELLENEYINIIGSYHILAAD